MSSQARENELPAQAVSHLLRVRTWCFLNEEAVGTAIDMCGSGCHVLAEDIKELVEYAMWAQKKIVDYQHRAMWTMNMLNDYRDKLGIIDYDGMEDAEREEYKAVAAKWNAARKVHDDAVDEAENMEIAPEGSHAGS